MKKTTEQFILESINVHGNKFTYDKVNYKNNKTKVCITCPIHGDFWQIPTDHLNGCGCPKCSVEHRNEIVKTKLEDFIQKSIDIHGNYYDYSKVVYINSSTKVCIICPEHGEFWKTPHKHLSGQGCPLCKRHIKTEINTNHSTKRLTKDEFIKKTEKVHGKKYDYSNVVYINNKTKVCIICPIHGEFWQRPDVHLKGQGCPFCKHELIGDRKRMKTEEFIERSNMIHMNKYDYSKTNLNERDENGKVCITCPIHGDFWQRPNAHLKGEGCKKCNTSKLEKDILNVLIERKINYAYNVFPSFLNGLQIDFYLPDFNVGIECQGSQHFIKNHFFEELETVQERDKRKFKLCEEHGITLYYYSRLGINYPYKVYEDKERLLNEILNGKKAKK